MEVPHSKDHSILGSILGFPIHTWKLSVRNVSALLGSGFSDQERLDGRFWFGNMLPSVPKYPISRYLRSGN